MTVWSSASAGASEMAQHQTRTRAQYQKLYNEKADRLREAMTLQKANFGPDTDPVLVHEIRELDKELVKIKAALDALETVDELGETLPRVEDRRADVNNETRLHVMVATVQATVAEFASLRKRVDDGFEEMSHLMQRNWYVTLAIGGALMVVVMLLLAGKL